MKRRRREWRRRYKTEKVMVTLPAGVRLDPSAFTVNGTGTPMGMVFAGAVLRVERVARTGVVADAIGDNGGLRSSIGRSSTSTSTEPVAPARAAGAIAVISLGDDAGNDSFWPPMRHSVGRVEAHAVDDDGSAGERKPLRLDGVGVKNPSVVGVIGAAVAALVGDAEADDFVSGRSDEEPGFAHGVAIDGGAH